MSDLALTSRDDTYFQIRISRNTFFAFLLSILLHALLLFSPIPRLLLKDAASSKPIPLSVNIQLNPVAPKIEAPSPPARAPEPPPPPVHARKSAPKVMAVPAHGLAHDPASKTVTLEQPAQKLPEVPAAAPIPPPVAAPDLMSYMQAARERRRLAESGSQASAPEHAPSAEDIRLANIKRNLQTQGTNGLFQIMSMGVRNAEFSFRGWTTDITNSRREVIEVEVGAGVDLERAVIRRMIELIRKHYNGDFYWESIRLGRVVTMSARVEDSAELEDFMMQEFFGPGTRYPAP